MAELGEVIERLRMGIATNKGLYGPSGYHMAMSWDIAEWDAILAALQATERYREALAAARLTIDVQQLTIDQRTEREARYREALEQADGLLLGVVRELARLQAQTSGASPQIGWREMTQEEIDRVRCKATRGPRSHIQCEVYEGHNDSHAGRGQKGQWFTW